MKKVLLLGLALLFVSSAVSAQQLGLYIDNTRTSWCSDAMVVYAYLWGYFPNGLQCVEVNTILMTEPVGEDPYPSIPEMEFDALAPVYNAEVADPVMGSFPNSDLGACYDACYSDWTWLVYVRMFIYTSVSEPDSAGFPENSRLCRRGVRGVCSDQSLHQRMWPGWSRGIVLGCHQEYV
jgi:hypothetical protein